MKKCILLLIVSSMLFSCGKSLLGDEEVNTQENNFELFWKDFDTHYGLFQARNFNWDGIYNEYRPKVNVQTTDEQLWDIFSNMVAYLDDSHTFILNTKTGEKFVSGSEDKAQVEEEFSIDLIKSKYLENIYQVSGVSPEDGNYLYGNIKGRDIGYIYFNGMKNEEPNTFMDEIIGVIQGYDAIILDIRNNTGGDDVIAQEIAGRFADGEHFVYSVQTRNGPNHNDFSSKRNYHTKKLGSTHFSKPVVVLTDRITVSAAEILLLHMKAFDQVTQIGDVTAGDFSDTGMRRFLPNGWQYQYSIMMYLQPDGTSLDGVGHMPNIQVRNTIGNINAEYDKVLETAFKYLFEKYGIE